jgi:hypothetical protein
MGNEMSNPDCLAGSREDCLAGAPEGSCLASRRHTGAARAYARRGCPVAGAWVPEAASGRIELLPEDARCPEPGVDACPKAASAHRDGPPVREGTARSGVQIAVDKTR